MTYTKDANELAAEHSRRNRSDDAAGRPRIIWGTLTIWSTVRDVAHAEIVQSQDVQLDLSKPGLVITYDRQGDAEIFVTQPGWYMNFVPNRDAGE